MAEMRDTASAPGAAIRAWYKTKRWQELRIAVLTRDLFTCQKTGVPLMGSHPSPDSPVIHHRIPHKGDEHLFWDMNNLPRLINGGLNGFADRLHWYTRTALVLAGYAPDAITSFQIDAQRAGLLPADEPGKPSQVDGVAGPKTRAALHMMLAKAQPVEQPAVTVKAAPVTEEVETPVVVAPQGAGKTLWTRINAVWLAIAVPFSAFGSLSTPWKIALVTGVVLSIAFLLWKGELIAARVRSVVKAFGE
jgi:hypothetical protein